MKELMEIRNRLKEIAEAEATRLFRMARRAQAHGCKAETVAAIREEAHQLHITGYPERLVSWDTHYYFKYAFK